MRTARTVRTCVNGQQGTSKANSTIDVGVEKFEVNELHRLQPACAVRDRKVVLF